MKIALDAMGGDCGSRVLIDGAVQAVEQHSGIEVILLGPEELLREELALRGKAAEPRLSIVHAPQTVSMAEEAVEAVRRKKDSTIMVGFDLVKKGQAEAVVSAGHSGATMTAAILQLGRLKGIARPSIASFFPTLKEPVLVTDIGANVDCRPQHLYQFAVMASFCCKLLLNRAAAPRVGLLSIGEEPGKGNAAVKEAYDLLKDSSLNFIGNVEGRDVYGGNVDVVICDGFVGNIALKVSEGLAEAMQQMLKTEIKKSWQASLASFLFGLLLTASANGWIMRNTAARPCSASTGLASSATAPPRQSRSATPSKRRPRWWNAGLTGPSPCTFSRKRGRADAGGSAWHRLLPA